MRATTPRARVGKRFWLVTLLLALLVGAGIGAWVVSAHQPERTASGPACPSPARAVTWPAPPTQTVSYNPPATTPAPVTLGPSETLEVDLLGRWTWQLRTTTVGPTLSLETPAGYVDAGGASCVWRFAARQVGTERLRFFGNGMCPGTEATCVAAFLTLTVTVSAGAEIRQPNPSRERA